MIAAPAVPLPPSAARFCEAVAARPLEPLAVAVTGPDGCGGTTLLAALRATYRHAHVPVAGLAQVLEGRVDPATTAVVVDDAQEAGPEALARLTALAQDPAARLVVAYRPWPRPAALTDLVAVLRQRRRPVVLSHLDPAQVSAWAGAAWGAPLPSGVLDLLLTQAGGLPTLVHQLLRCLHDAPPAPGTSPVVPERTLQRLRHDLDQLDAEVRHLLLVLALGLPVDQDAVTAALRVPVAEADELLDRARATGLLRADGALVPLAARTLVASCPAERVHGLQRSLLASAVERGDAPAALALARSLARAGCRDPRVAASLEDAGRRCAATDPVLARALHAEALDAGSPPAPGAARRAELAVLLGDLDAGLREVDGLLAEEDPPDLARAVAAAATALARRGALDRSAELHRWLGPERSGARAGLGAVALMGVGDRAGAQALLAQAQRGGPPTLTAGAAALVARGVQESVDGAAADALSTLTRASAVITATGPASLLLDTPASLAALLALSTGQLAVAEQVLASALEAGQGGPAAQPRHLLLRAWTAMLAGQADRSHELLHRASPEPGGGDLEPRDDLFRCALQVGLARRASDAPALLRAWAVARDRIVFHPVDLYALLPLGELALGAARLREGAHLEPHLARAWALLERLGGPDAWASPLHWYGVQAAILTERPGDLEPHARALVRASSRSRYAAALSAAGHAWMSVLVGGADPAEVEAAARGLAAVGLAWDGSRLAGQAAARTTDRRTMATLLQCARSLQGPAVGRPSSASGTAADGAEPSGGSGAGEAGAANGPAARRPLEQVALSPRERDVAALVVRGETYREVGAKLFLSPKTVEHHVARIRQRTRATDRSDLMARLRVLLAESEPRG